ncbi:MAG: hypothetical protein ACLQVN_20080 [Bryobacteraceae bacterium]
MKVVTKTRKLAELRAKTDRQLLEIIDIHLSRGLAYIRQMAEADSRELCAIAEKFRNLASREHTEAERLQKLLEASGEDRHAAARLRELREYLSASAVRSACA